MRVLKTAIALTAMVVAVKAKHRKAHSKKQNDVKAHPKNHVSSIEKAISAAKFNGLSLLLEKS